MVMCIYLAAAATAAAFVQRIDVVLLKEKKTKKAYLIGICCVVQL